MPLYRYEAAAASGELVSGEIDAATQDAVIEQLHAQGYIPIRADIAGGRLFSSLATPRLSGRSRQGRSLVFITQQLGTLLQAGLSLDRALEISETVIASAAERATIHAVLEKVRAGSSFADALAAQGEIFPGFYIGMVRAGEAGGSLDVTLRQLAQLLERAQAAREHVKSALVYPTIVLLTGTLSIAVLFGFVIPRFRPMFEGTGADVPFVTQMVLTASDIVLNDWWIVLAVLLLAFIVGRQYLKSAQGRRRWHTLLLRLPLLGELVTKIEIARFSRTLGTLLKNGVSPLTALAITEETVSNLVLRDALASVVDSVKEGKGFAEPLARTGVVPPLAVQLTRVGEETAKLDEMLLKIGEIYDQESQRSIERLLALLVPGVTIVLGLVVAVVMGSILTAILSVYDLAL
jgi:general secretion pathway protein F